MRPEDVIIVPWGVWIVSWVAAGLWSGRTVKSPGFGRQWPYRILELLGFALLLGFRQGHQGFGAYRADSWRDFFSEHFWAVAPDTGWLLVGLAIAGFLFSWWARLHLGRLWSGSVTKKEGHHVVDSGPYAIVRHPIYTGLLLAAAATAAVEGSGYALSGFVVLFVGFWLKARLEERFLRAELGAHAYDAYARRTAMLIPFARI